VSVLFAKYSCKIDNTGPNCKCQPETKKGLPKNCNLACVRVIRSSSQMIKKKTHRPNKSILIASSVNGIHLYPQPEQRSRRTRSQSTEHCLGVSQAEQTCNERVTTARSVAHPEHATENQRPKTANCLKRAEGFLCMSYRCCLPFRGRSNQ